MSLIVLFRIEIFDVTMIKLFKNIINSGVTGNTAKDNDLRIVNIISLGTIGVVLTYVPLTIWRQIIEGGNYFIIAWTAFCSALIFFAPFFFTIRKKHIGGALFLSLMGIIEIFMFTVLFWGPEARVQYFMIALPSLFLLMFNKRKNYKYFFLCTLFSLPPFFYLDLFLKKPYFNYLGPDFPMIVLQCLSTSGAICLLVISVFFFAHNLNIARDDLAIEHERANSLLLNILPESIANQLKSDRKTIADGFAEVTIIFADIVDFTKIASKKSPEDLVHILNICFSKFDELSELHGIEKIKTIGDSYMAVSGIPESCEVHAEKVAKFAVDVIKEVEYLSNMLNTEIKIRIGINSGPVTAGVIGTKKFIYDLWGDAVNLASRMESHGIPGKIQVTDTSYNLLKNKFVFSKRNNVEIKGKGFIDTYILESALPEIEIPDTSKIPMAV